MNSLSRIPALFRRLALMAKRRNTLSLIRFVATLVGLVTAFSIIFQILMAFEGQTHSWTAGFYWSLTTMSTLGYGDITFTTDSGRLFSILVLLSGIIFMLVLLPFTFIELFYEPWMRSRTASRVPRIVPASINGHVILTNYDPVTIALIPKLEQFDYPYVLVLADVDEVLELNEKGVCAYNGELNDPVTYANIRAEHAAMVATTRSDIENTSVVFTARSISDELLIIATARDETSNEVLKLAGCKRVLDLTYLMAESLARRAIGGSSLTHIVGRIDDLLIAEVNAQSTTLMGMDYSEAQWKTSVSIVGYWARGSFEFGQPDSSIVANSTLLLAGSTSQLREFNDSFRSEDSPTEFSPVVIIGGGRVGRATAAALQRRGIDYRIVEQLPERIFDKDKTICGSAAIKSVLITAGIEKAPTVILSPRDDQTNIYLTIFCRLLRPDIQIICRSTFENNVAGLHRAGADIVMSYASMGSNALFNLLRRSDLLMVAEGLDVFKILVPDILAGKTIMESNIRQLTGCSVIGIDNHKETITDLDPNSVFPEGAEIVLIGAPTGESEFLRLFRQTDR